MATPDKRLRSLADGVAVDAEKVGTEFMTQLVRLLRVHMSHQADNQTAQRVREEFINYANALLEEVSELQLQCVADKLYFNGEFIKLGGGAFDTAAQGRKIYKRLGICEVALLAPLREDSLHEFILGFQSCYQSDDPKRLSTLKFSGVKVRGLGESKTLAIDRRMELARTYAQLIILFQEAGEALVERRRVAVPQVRRSLQQLIDAADGQESLLAGLTRFDNPNGDVATHAVAVCALSVLMGRRLGLSRKDLVALGLAALFHDVGRLGLPEEVNQAPKADSSLKEALYSILLISRFTGSAEALLRTSVAFEHNLPAAGDGSGVIPSSSARIVAAASRFDLMTNPAPPNRGLRPDQALRLMLDHAGSHFDRRVLRLLTSVVGVHPVGSVVRLSGNRVAVVIGVPDDPAGVARPTVKVIEERGRPVDYVLELMKEPRSVEIVDVVDAREEQVNVTHYLLA